MEIYANQKELHDNNHACIGFGGYLKEENLNVHVYDSSVYVTDLTNALETGKTCEQYTFHLFGPERYGHSSGFEVWKIIVEKLGGYDKALMLARSVDFPINKWGGFNSVDLPDIGLTVYKTLLKAKRIFSPFALNKIKPLTSEPAKWTLTHVYKAIINRQFKELKCNGYYTDDYAHDAACNFRQGEIAAPMEFIKDILQDPSGWYCYKNGDRVTINCHHFYNNSFVPAI